MSLGHYYCRSWGHYLITAVPWYMTRYKSGCKRKDRLIFIVTPRRSFCFRPEGCVTASMYFRGDVDECVLRWCHYDGGAGGAALSLPRVCVVLLIVCITIYILCITTVVCHTLCARAAIILHEDMDYTPRNRRYRSIAHSLQRWVSKKSSISQPKCFIF